MTGRTKGLREAAAGSFEARREAIWRAAKAMAAGVDGAAPMVVALFDDTVVMEAGGKLTQYDYTVAANGAALTNAQPVEETFRIVEETAREAAALVESLPAAGAGGEGGRWLIRAIRAGLSGNGIYYPDSVLREAAPKFSGARVLVRADEDHLAGRAKDVRNLIGRLAAPAFIEAQGGAPGEIRAELELIEPEGAIAIKLREAWSRGMTDLMGFSIVAGGHVRVGRINGKPVRIAESIERIESVDLIVEPGAGGRLINLIEARAQSEDRDMKLRDKMIAFIEARLPDQAAALDREDDEAVETLYREAVAGEAAAGAIAAAGGTGGETQPLTPEDVDERIAGAVRLTEARAEARVEIAASPLPEAAKTRLTARFAEAAAIGGGEVARAIEAERSYLAGIAGAGAVTGLGEEGARASLIEGRDEKVAKMFDALLDPADSTMTSLKEAYIQVTGDARVTGLARDCDAVLMREALTAGSLAEVLGDSIARRMIADYRDAGVYDVWRRVASVVPLSDFRTQHRTRWGGYGDLPEVAESAPYTALASPTDEEVTYAPVKRGGTEEVTLETVKNDDAGVVMRIPTKLSRAAQRTLAKFVLDLIVTNPIMDYDSVALFHASHDNLGSATLDRTGLAAARVAMLKQPEKDSADRLGIGPRAILVPPDLEEEAVNLFRRSTENDRTFVQSLSLDVLSIWYWTDANDWYLVADPMDIPCLEVGFLDGREEPELFVQDSPTVGSLFSHDKITYKIRHIYGGDVLDHRGLYKAAVT